MQDDMACHYMDTKKSIKYSCGGHNMVGVAAPPSPSFPRDSSLQEKRVGSLLATPTTVSVCGKV